MNKQKNNLKNLKNFVEKKRMKIFILKMKLKVVKSNKKRVWELKWVI